jgi:hypothetical protein
VRGHGLVDDLVDVAEVVVDGAFGQRAGVGNRARRAGGYAVAGEHVPGRFDDLVLLGAPVVSPWGGVTELGGDDQRQPQWIPYAPVTDLGAAVERAVQLGAAVVRQRVDLPQGSVAVVTDPGGATVALWEPAPVTRP